MPQRTFPCLNLWLGEIWTPLHSVQFIVKSSQLFLFLFQFLKFNPSLLIFSHFQNWIPHLTKNARRNLIFRGFLGGPIHYSLSLALAAFFGTNEFAGPKGFMPHQIHQIHSFIFQNWMTKIQFDRIFVLSFFPFISLSPWINYIKIYSSSIFASIIQRIWP